MVQPTSTGPSRPPTGQALDIASQECFPGHPPVTAYIKSDRAVPGSLTRGQAARRLERGGPRPCPAEKNGRTAVYQQGVAPQVVHGDNRATTGVGDVRVAGTGAENGSGRCRRLNRQRPRMWAPL